jgi:hypothetical protein
MKKRRGNFVRSSTKILSNFREVAPQYFWIIERNQREKSFKIQKTPTHPNFNKKHPKHQNSLKNEIHRLSFFSIHHVFIQLAAV